MYHSSHGWFFSVNTCDLVMFNVYLTIEHCLNRRLSQHEKSTSSLITFLRLLFCHSSASTIDRHFPEPSPSVSKVSSGLFFFLYVQLLRVQEPMRYNISIVGRALRSRPGAYVGLL